MKQRLGLPKSEKIPASPVKRGMSVTVAGGLGKLRFLFVVVSLLGALVAPGVAAAGPTLVSLTFDDGTTDQYQARAMLAQNGLRGTFFINSNNVGASSAFMTWSQLSDLSGDGNEIGGHTLDHVDLTTVTTTEAMRQVCDDRQALISHGFNATDFAYPFGSYDGVESIVQGCGYSSGRRSWGLCPIGQNPPNCDIYYPDVAERIPPVDRYAFRTIVSLRAWNTLSDIQSVVTRAENNGGGWVTLVFHRICDGCDPTNGYSVSPAILTSVLDWLQPRASNGTYVGTYVRTVRDVISDTSPPNSSIACNGPPCSGWYGPPVTVSLAAADAGTAVAAIRYTTDGTTPTTSSPLYSGPFPISATTTVKYRAWDMAGNVEATNSQLVQIDTTPPTSTIACNDSSCSTGWYTAGVSVSLSTADTGTGVAAIRYTTDGTTPTTSSPLYLTPFTVATPTTVKYRAWDVAGNVEPTKSQLIQVDTVAPSVRITSPRNGATVTGNVRIVASAADGQTGVASVSFYVDGSLVRRATRSPWQARWNTKKSRGGRHVLRAVATDRAGNSRRSTSVARTAVTVVAKEFKFTLSTKSARHGLVVFKVVNKGKLAHNFKIAGKKTKLLRPSQKATLKVMLRKGTYRYLCTVPGRARKGMRGVFKVT
jgi:peptidoglycan/xylan/chitin deacetylase (PgdA/CDA1 family)/plastocyanin